MFSDPDARSSSDSNRPEAILEVSEPTSPELEPFATDRRLSKSVLSDIIKSSSSEISSSAKSSGSKGPISSSSRTGESSLCVTGASGWKSGEAEPLISRDVTSELGARQRYGSTGDAESQVYRRKDSWQCIWSKVSRKLFLARQRLLHARFWTRQTLWENLILAPTYAIPAVLLGLLLNILDALSYGTKTAFYLVT